MRLWRLECSACDHLQPGDTLATVCPKCGQPLLVRYDGAHPTKADLLDRWDMWRYTPLMPATEGEIVSLGEGTTPMLDAPTIAKAVGVRRVWIKEEGLNPTGSFKARGMSAAVTRAAALGVKGFSVPTAGNAGAALAAYGAAARLPVRVFAPKSTPAAILNTIRTFGAELVLVDGHIGDAGKQARAFAAESGWFDMSTLREPYRIEGKKTMGLEVAEQMDWKRLPTHIIYPTGGGTGLIGMWKVFRELIDLGWLPKDIPLPRMIVAQATGCAPIVRAHAAGADRSTPWENPTTHAAGLRVPGPLGDRLILRAVRESAGDAVAISEEDIRAGTAWIGRETGIDAAPEGGCAVAVLTQMAADKRIGSDAEVVVFNTGSGASYRF
ncbi:MAG: threonine synthase [Gemmatimonadota bacterium]